MNNFINKLYGAGIVPVIKIDDVSKAVPLAKALLSGGLNVLEITFRTECACEAIKKIKEEVNGVTIIAGTVLTIENAEKAVRAGAEAIVAPGLNEEVVLWCKKNNVNVCPGVSTASEIEKAISLGLSFVKFFPAEAVGGLKAIKSLSAPYADMKFMPTGGISEQNICEYLAFDKVIACGGSWMVSEELICSSDFTAIEKLAKEAVSKMLGLSLAHVGINCSNEKESENIASKIANLSGFEVKNGSASVFLNNAIEVMKSPFLGAKGHIALSVNNVDRAVAFYKARGIKFNENTKKYDKDNKLIAIYFDVEIGGFAYHLVRK